MSTGSRPATRPHRLKAARIGARVRTREGGEARPILTLVPTADESQSAAQSAQPESRVRSAGGPQDLASYNCECGLVFSAPVSTTVLCPHCGTAQAW
jgi:hypothetical protein